MYRRYIWFAAVAAILSAPQSFAQSPLLECAALENPADRLVCFEDLAAKERVAQADKFATPRTAERPADPATPEEARAKLGAEQVIRESVQKAKSVEEGGATKTARQQAREGLAFQVSRSQKDAEQRHVFYMNDGQVWREIEPSSIYFPRGKGFDVVIHQGTLNDYRLRVGGKGRFTRVVRLR